MTFDDPTLGWLSPIQELRESLPDLVTDVFQVITNTAVYLLIPIAGAMYLIWFRDRRAGDMLMVNVLTALNLNRFIKNIVKQPRPWVRDPSLVPAEGVNHSSGYSFPSGHCANAMAGFGSIALYAGKRAVTVSLTVLILLIALSRLYLGVHTPMDVAAGLLLGVCVILVNSKLLAVSERSDGDFRKISFTYMAAFAPVSVILVAMADVDLGISVMGVTLFYGYFVGRHIEHLIRPTDVCRCDVPHSMLYFAIGAIPVGLAVLLLPELQDVIGGGIAGAFGGLWISLLYPLLLQRFVR